MNYKVKVAESVAAALAAVGLALLCLLGAGCRQSAPTGRSLEMLDPARIPSDLRFPGQPRELVAVIASESANAGIGVSAVTFSPDGRRLAGGFGSGTLVVWDTGTLEEVAALDAHHMKPISAVTFTPDGQTLIDACFDHTVCLWDIADGQLHKRATLTGHTGKVWTMALAPDGKTLASAAPDDYGIRLWDLACMPPTERRQVRVHALLWSVSIAPDGRTLACTSGRTIVLWDVGGDTPQQTATLAGHGDTVWRVTYAPSGGLLASAGRDKTVRVWDTRGSKPHLRWSKTGHDIAEVYGLAFSPDGKWLVSTDDTGRVVRWDVTNGTEQNRWHFPKGVRNLAVAPDGRHLAVGCLDARVYLLRFPN